MKGRKNNFLLSSASNQGMIAKTIAFKNNTEFMKLVKDGGFKVNDIRRKQINEVIFDSFIAQNGIVTKFVKKIPISNKDNAKKSHKLKLKLIQTVTRE